MKQQVKVIFSDVDGTLLNTDHRMSADTEAAIHRVTEAGIPFLIVSARSPSGIYPIMKRYHLTGPVVAYSGGLILDEEGNVLSHIGFSRDKAVEVWDYIEAEKFDLSASVYSVDEWIVKDRSDPRVAKEEAIVEAEAREGTPRDFASDTVNKFLCICAPDATDRIQASLTARFPDLGIVKSSAAQLEIMPRGVNKATAVGIYCARCGISPADAVAFGDNYNDAEMLSAVGTGFLMANAPEELKARGFRLTDDCNHDGIAHALAEMGL